METLLIGLFLAVAFVVAGTLLRRRGDEKLYKRTTVALVVLTFAVVLSIIVAIQLGFITSHVP